MTATEKDFQPVPPGWTLGTDWGETYIYAEEFGEHGMVCYDTEHEFYYLPGAGGRSRGPHATLANAVRVAETGWVDDAPA